MYSYLEEINEEVKKCTKCKLCNMGRKQTVFGIRKSKSRFNVYW